MQSAEVSGSIPAVCVQDHLVVTLFLTMLVGAGGNAGNQSAIKVIRGLVRGLLPAWLKQHLGPGRRAALARGLLPTWHLCCSLDVASIPNTLALICMCGRGEDAQHVYVFLWSCNRGAWFCCGNAVTLCVPCVPMQATGSITTSWKSIQVT